MTSRGGGAFDMSLLVGPSAPCIEPTAKRPKMEREVAEAADALLTVAQQPPPPPPPPLPPLPPRLAFGAPPLLRPDETSHYTHIPVWPSQSCAPALPPLLRHQPVAGPGFATDSAHAKTDAPTTLSPLPPPAGRCLSSHPSLLPLQLPLQLPPPPDDDDENVFAPLAHSHTPVCDYGLLVQPTTPIVDIDVAAALHEDRLCAGLPSVCKHAGALREEGGVVVWASRVPVCATLVRVRV